MRNYWIDDDRVESSSQQNVLNGLDGKAVQTALAFETEEIGGFLSNKRPISSYRKRRGADEEYE